MKYSVALGTSLRKVLESNNYATDVYKRIIYQCIDEIERLQKLLKAKE